MKTLYSLLLSISIVFFATLNSFGQTNDTITIMNYNILNYVKTNGTGDCDQINNSYITKGGYIQTIMGHALPDILGVEEMQGGSGGQANADLIHDALRDVLDASPGHSVGDWARLPYDASMAGQFVSSQLYWNTNKFTWQSTTFIDVDNPLAGEPNSTSRDVPVVQLRFYKNDNLGNPIDIYVLVAHLSPSSGAVYEARRDYETNAVRTWLDANLTGGKNIMIMGDFNVYSDTELGFQNLISGGDATTRFYDPINRLGSWSSNSSFADIHTQATRLNAISTPTDPLYCGSIGGSDDRFDFILATDNIINGTNKVKYIAGSYETLGQDGLHYNQDINNGINSSAPASVITALHANSDHLPVKYDLEFEVGATLFSSVTALNGFTYLEGTGPSANQTFTINGSGLMGSGDITVTGTTNYEVSTDGIIYADSVTYPFAGGTITNQPNTVYTRLKTGLVVGNYNSEMITISGGSATTVNIACNGTVTGIVVDPIAWINEFHYDNAGADADEMIEIIIDNSSSYVLSDFLLETYNGGNGAVLTSADLSTFVVGITSGTATIYTKALVLQNGSPDGLALSYQGNLLQFLSYEGDFVAVGGSADGITSTDVGVSESGSTLLGESLQLSGTGCTYSDFTWQAAAANTMGLVNNGQAICISVDINEQSKQKALTIYPNPNNGSFNIRGLEKEMQISIFNAMGQLVYEAQASSNNNLTINGLGKGIYVIRVAGDDMAKVLRIVVQ